MGGTPPPPAEDRINAPTTPADAPPAIAFAPTETPLGDGTTTPAGTAQTINAAVWSDNWFALYVDETLVKEDSVAITTERSFNSEVFSFDATYPLHINVVLKDYIQNDTGLEYIGTDRQQIGDGGFIAQFSDAATGTRIAVTNSSWKCTPIHIAPLDPACAAAANPTAGQGACTNTIVPEPDGWKTQEFDDTAWPAATVYDAGAVGPKEGYDDISWDRSAQFIWGPDLKTNNTVLCRVTIQAP
jgi:hypothetical protein